VLVRDERTTKHTLDRVVHPHTRFKQAKRVKPPPLIPKRHARSQRHPAHRAHAAAQLRVQRKARIACGSDLGESGVDERAEHHGDHEGGEDVAEWERGEDGVFLEGGDPEEDEEVHRSFEACLREAEDEEERVCIS